MPCLFDKSTHANKRKKGGAKRDAKRHQLMVKGTVCENILGEPK